MNSFMTKQIFIILVALGTIGQAQAAKPTSYQPIANCYNHSVELVSYRLPGTLKLRGQVRVTATEGLAPLVEKCELTFFPGGQVSCQAASIYVHFDPAGTSYIIPAGHHDPLTVTCEGGPFTPPPSGFSAGN